MTLWPDYLTRLPEWHAALERERFIRLARTVTLEEREAYWKL